MARFIRFAGTSAAVRYGLLLLVGAATSFAVPPDEAVVVQAMHKATEYMLNTVSNRGGFVGMYTEDLTEQWGEVPARRSMVWVQEPGTASVGAMLLEVYTQTGDSFFLDAAKACANALVWGQLPCGGWNYFIDFEPEGTAQWYKEVGKKAWGWEEFYHFHGNATFDDDVTAGAANFLLDLYTATMDSAYRDAVQKTLDFVIESQYPEGGWPQRYPPHGRTEGEGHMDYSQFYTFNDGVIAGNIRLLLKAHKLFGEDRYLRAARRGMYFVVLSQWGSPQAGWADQYDLDLKPGAARSYEPAALSPGTTVNNIHLLLDYYKITGDRRFLRGIPEALAWLESATLPPGHSTEGHTHAQFVEVGTGKPLYAHREGTGIEDGRYWVDYEPSNFPGHYGMQIRLDLAPCRAEYERVFALTPEEAMAEYEAKAQEHTPLPEVSAEEAARILGAMNGAGAWIEDLSAPDHRDWKNRPRHCFRGISTRTYSANMRALSAYLCGLR